MKKAVIDSLLAGHLETIKALDPSDPRNKLPITPENYQARNAHILRAMSLAMLLGMPCGFLPDLNAATPFTVVGYIDLPTGQISWHFMAYPNDYDGHTVAEKYDRIDAYTSGNFHG